jgi:hypothetical protein
MLVDWSLFGLQVDKGMNEPMRVKWKAETGKKKPLLLSVGNKTHNNMTVMMSKGYEIDKILCQSVVPIYSQIT